MPERATVDRASREAFAQSLADACALLRPPEKLSISEWADKYAYLSAEGSSRPGKYYVANAEYQRFPLDLLSPGSGYETVVLMWASQIGKTLIGLHFTAYHMHHDPQPIIFVEPTEDLCKVIVRDRIDPMIRDTPVLTPLFGKQGGKGGGNDTMMKYYPGGSFAMAWANSPSQLASRARGAAVTDEEGRMEPNKEGDPVQQLRKRMATFKLRKHLRTSSPSLRSNGFTKAHEQSDQYGRFLPCPDCGHMQMLRFEQMKWIRNSAEPEDYTLSDCWYECECCSFKIREADKYQMDRNGEWRLLQRGGDGKTAGLQLSSLYSTLGYEWSEIVSEYLQCEPYPEKLRVFHNTVLALPWDEQAEGADMNEIQRHAEDYPAQAPAGVLFVTCGADVQKDRIEATKWGWGLHGHSWMLQHKVIEGDPLQPGTWRAFEAWRTEQLESERGVFLPTACTLVDSGDGNRQQAVLQYTKSHEHLGVRACKGASQTSAPLVSEARRVGRIKALQVLIGGAAAKDFLYGRFQIYDKSAAGAVHFPKHSSSGATPQYFKHLTAEVLVTHHTRAGEVARWENPHKRNEALDCAVYALAAKEFLRPDFPAIARKLEQRVAQLRERNALLQITAPERAARVAAALQPSPSSASSAASPSPTSARPRLRPRRFQLPGAHWVNG